MKIVIAPDSFKESLSAFEAASCIQKGFEQVYPDAEYIKLPLADGGEGTVDIFLQNLNGQRQTSNVSGPIGQSVEANWALIDDGKTAVIEIAAASGLTLLSSHQRNPEITTSFGTGELIRQALDAGVDKIILGLGGSATNDGGAGIIQALGVKLLNKEGNELDPGGTALNQLADIDFSELHSRAKKVEVIIAADVSNPLCGSNGASAIFGPQKGATPEQVSNLDRALHNFATVAARYTGINHTHTSGFGAAGGTPLGLSLIFNVEMKPGIKFILNILNAKKIIKNANLIITGEGKIDNQTLQGKTPFGIAKLANQQNIPVIAIAGSLGEQTDKLYPTFKAVFATVRAPCSLETALTEAEQNLIKTSANIARCLKLGNFAC